MDPESNQSSPVIEASSKLYWIIGGVVILAVIAYLLASQGASLLNQTGLNPTPQATLENNSLDTTNEATDEASLDLNTEVTLDEQNDSGQTGVATLVENEGKVVVSIVLTGGKLTTPQPAHIHSGVCPEPGAVKYPLNNVVNGKSETTLNTTIADLQAELPLAINVHKSQPELSVYNACGDL